APNGSSSEPNVLVFGHTDGGVSSVVNLIARKVVAGVSDGTSRCTERVDSYHVKVEGPNGTRSVNLYDIPGFDGTAESPVQFPSVPISLAIICTQDLPNQVKATANYLKNKWDKHGGVPVIVVINHRAPTPDPAWWGTNGKHFVNIAALKDHACLTRGIQEESKILLHELIMQHLPPG
ncbi:hypothetical protein BU15DRAFT_54872, partial [Melanogaster broomeanus]